MQNQKNYQNFQDQQEFTGGIPVGRPVQIQLQNVNQAQQPYYPQPVNPYQHANQFPNMMPPPPIFPPNNQAQFIPPVQQNNPRVYNNSISIRCQCCKQNVQTIVNKQSGNTTVLWATAIFCLVGQCCCLPYLIDDCLDKAHYCPNCGQAILRKHAKCFDMIN